MQSSYNVIKSVNVNSIDSKEISTVFDINKEPTIELDPNVKAILDSYENLARSMVENARKECDNIRSKSCEESEKIIRDANAKAQEIYKSSYDKGYIEGKNEGYKEAYEKNIVAARMEVDRILLGAREEYIKYMTDKQNEIRNLICSLVENVFKREIKDKEALNAEILDAITAVKKSSMFIIKCRNVYADSIKEKIEDWKSYEAYGGDIFVVADDSLDEGMALIEKDSGRIIISEEEALKKVKEIIYSEQ